MWSFVAAYGEQTTDSATICSCTNTNIIWSHSVPYYVGNDYCCDTGNSGGSIGNSNTVFSDDPLWDGEGCGPTSTCCQFNSPPWFCKSLGYRTTQDLELRLSTRDGLREDILVSLVELYVQ